MKRQRNCENEQPTSKRPGVVTDVFHSQIAAKLHTLLDEVLSETKVPQNANSDRIKVPDLGTLIESSALKDFIKSAKSCISELLAETAAKNGILNSDANLSNVECCEHASSLHNGSSSSLSVDDIPDGDKVRCKSSGKEKENTLPGKNSTIVSKSKIPELESLQTQISQKIQSLLCKALDQRKLKCGKADTKEQKAIQNCDGEWQSFTSTIQDVFKSRFSQFLSNNSESQNKNCSSSNQGEILGQENNSSNGVVSCQLNENNVHVEKYVPYCCHLHSSINKTSLPFEKSAGASLSSSLSMEPEMTYGTVVSYNSSPPRFLTEPEENPVPEHYESGSGILLLEDAVPAPDVLDLGVKSDLEDNSNDTDSESDVVILDVKHPTYEVITLEEDDDEDEVIEESNVEKKAEELFQCPQCSKGFRAESLLKFHIRMHGENSTLPETSPSEITSSQDSNNQGSNDENQASDSTQRSTEKVQKAKKSEEKSSENETGDPETKKMKFYKNKKHRVKKTRKQKARK